MPELSPPTTPGAATTSDPTRFVLIGTSHPGNVGAAARAMKVMGFSDLVLVAPRFADVLSRDETIAMASGATDILSNARTVPTLADALDGVTWACATAMTPRDFGPPTAAPRKPLCRVGWTGAPAGVCLRQRALRHGQRRCVPLPRLPQHSHPPGLRFPEPGAGGATAGL